MLRSVGALYSTFKLGLTCDEASMLHGRVLGPAADAPDTMD